MRAAYGDDNSIAWNENLGNGVFSARKIVTTDVYRPYAVYAADLDGDGGALSASYLDSRVAWYENLGGGAFSNQQAITAHAPGARSVYAADLDGDIDVLSGGDDGIRWYENLGKARFPQADAFVGLNLSRRTNRSGAILLW